MKTNRISILNVLAVLLVSGLFYACSDSVDPAFNETNSVNAFLKKKAPTAENFTVSAETGGTLTTTRGSKIVIPANAFVTASGEAVTGNVEVKMKEITSKADMIFAGAFTMSNDGLLNSGGEYFLQASQNGSALRVADGENIEVTTPAQAVNGDMQLFFAGQQEDPDDVNEFIWVPADTTANQDSVVTYNPVDSTYRLVLDSLGWINIDAFVGESAITCTFNLTGITGLNDENTRAYGIFTGVNGVIAVGRWYGNITDNVITENRLVSLPVNILVVSTIDDKFYYGLLALTPTAGGAYSIPMTLTTEDELEDIIRNIP